MHFLVTGGTGFIGRPLVEKLLARGDQITLLTRDFEKAKKMFNGPVNLIGAIEDSGLEVDGVINLAGAPIIDKRWTNKRKRVLKQSRIGITNDIIAWLKKCDKKPECLISGSAIGYYGNYPEATRLDEKARPRQCFASELCGEWESTAQQAETLGLRVCRVRTGVVLAKHGGALKRMLLPFSLGLGGRIASGNQWFSWIHLDDMVALLLFLIDNKSIEGAVNATAPYPVNNAYFSRVLAKMLKRPMLMPMPAVIAVVLFGEASELLLEGQQVVPKKLLDSGFEFRYPRLNKALESILRTKPSSPP
jgi:uncharacterized protein (TIGR01777 family)